PQVTQLAPSNDRPGHQLPRCGPARRKAASLNLPPFLTASGKVPLRIAAIVGVRGRGTHPMTPNDRSRLFRSRASQALQASAQALDARAGAELLRIAEAWHALAIQAERG